MLQSPTAVILQPKKIKSVTASVFPSSICHEVMQPDAMILVFWMLSFKPAFYSPLTLSSRGSLVPLTFLPLEKWTLYHNRQLLAQWLDWEAASKHFPKLNLHLKMIMVTVWWSAACLIHYSFLNPSKTGEVCSANQWDALKTPTPAASIGQRKGPSSSLWKCGPHVITHNWVMKFCLICYIHLTSRQLITISSIISTTSCRDNTSQPAWDRKCFPRVHWIQNHEYWHYRNKQTYFSMAESVDCSGSYFD